MAPCEFACWPTNPLRGSCVSERSRCGAVRTFYVADEPSAGIVRVGALSLWRRANLHVGRQTLCGDRACRIALAVAPCEFARWPMNPLRGSCVSDRSRCGAVRLCTLADGSLSLWRRANLHAGRRTLCGDRACQIALAVAPCKFARWPMNPVRGSCVSDRSRCGAVRICTLADEPSARIVRVGSLSLWFSLKLSTKVVCEARSRTSGLRMASVQCSKQIGLSIFLSPAMTQGPSNHALHVQHPGFNLYKSQGEFTLNLLSGVEPLYSKKDATLGHISLTASRSDLSQPCKLQC